MVSCNIMRRMLSNINIENKLNTITNCDTFISVNKRYIYTYALHDSHSTVNWIGSAFGLDRR